MELDEKNIVAALRNGRQDEFEKMFRAWYNPLCAYAYGFLTSRDEAEETVQSVFIQLWSKRKQLEVETSLKSYLYRSVRNHCINVLKHEKVKKEHRAFSIQNGQTSKSDSDESLTTEELKVKISVALDQLPKECRRVFELSRFEELKYAEIAERLNISIKTVENQMGKALRIMRAELKEYLPMVLVLLKDFM